MLPFAFLLVACTATRPVAKIGLVAPFEGVYRHSGYAALAAMRAAIHETDSHGIEVMPLALDIAAEPAHARRTVAKLLSDPAVGAVVGPLTPGIAAAVAPQLADRSLPWYLPFARPNLPVRSLTDPSWVAPMVEAVAARASENGSTSLVLAGWSGFWKRPEAEAWTRTAGRHSMRLATGPADVRADDTVLWMGDAATGADYLAQLRTHYPDVPFWLATAGDDPVFYARALEKLHRLKPDAALGPIFTLAWLDDEYTRWAADHAPSSPTAYAVYTATRAAIATITHAELPGQTWTLEGFRLTDAGTWQRIESVSSPTGIDSAPVVH